MRIPLPLDDRTKTKLHFAQIGCIVLAIDLTCGRLAIKSPPPTRSNILALTVGLKSLVVIAYQMLTEHKSKFYRWASTKANAVLNSVEVVFWLTVVIVTIRVVGRESGVATGLNVMILLLSFVLIFLTAWVAIISIKFHRQGRNSPGNVDSARSHLVDDARSESSAGKPPRVAVQSVNRGV